MVACELDNDVSGDLMGWKLPDWQALMLHRVLPSCGGLIVYLSVICYDCALIYEHFQGGDKALAVFCIILMVFPALISLIFTLASAPPGLQTDLTAFKVQLNKKDYRWLIIQFVNFIFFPIAAIGRYCHQIFWWVEATCATRAGDGQRTQEAARRARAPSPLELYLFLQAFLHSAPYAVVNILNMLALVNMPSYDYDKFSVQAVSIVAGSLRMASTATTYRRFEREKICGKKYPWNINASVNKNIDDDESKEKQLNEQIEKSEEHIYEPLQIKNEIIEQEVDNTMRLNSNLIQFSPMGVKGPFFYDESDSDDEYLTPVQREDSRKSSGFESDGDSDYGRRMSIIDRVAPRRRDTQTYNIEHVEVPPPPVLPAPRPGSLAIWANKIVENAESIPTWLSAPPRRKYNDEVIKDEPDLPKRTSRWFIRGLEPQDVTASLVQFLGWYAFFVARLFSMAAFINFFPFVAIIVLFSHYQIMLLLLIVPQASTVRRGFYLFLAFIYLFCLMEFKIRFRHVRVWHVFWIIVNTIETIVFISLWATIDNPLDFWWRTFIVKIVIGSLLLSIMLFLVYFTILKPRETIIYMEKKTVN